MISKFTWWPKTETLLAVRVSPMKPLPISSTLEPLCNTRVPVTPSGAPSGGPQRRRLLHPPRVHAGKRLANPTRGPQEGRRGHRPLGRGGGFGSAVGEQPLLASARGPCAYTRVPPHLLIRLSCGSINLSPPRHSQGVVEALFRAPTAVSTFASPAGFAAAVKAVAPSSPTPRGQAGTLKTPSLSRGHSMSGVSAAAVMEGSHGYFDETLSAVMAAAQNQHQPAQVSLGVTRGY